MYKEGIKSFIEGNDSELLESKRTGKAGADSKVPQISKIESLPMVSKEYDALQRGHFLSDEQVLDILNQYREDTRKAVLLLEDNPNPLKEKIFLKVAGQKNKEWSLSYIIVPQGEVLRKNDDGIICVEGQDYITGPTYEDIRGLSSEGDIFALSGLMFCIRSEGNLRRLGQYINKELKTNFILLPLNAKPKIDRQRKTVYMYITDLDGDLYYSYRNSLTNEEQV
ncbi:MAG: hypothetical protein AAB723_02090 [Patescibacteria group bacterium]